MCPRRDGSVAGRMLLLILSGCCAFLWQIPGILCFEIPSNGGQTSILALPWNDLGSPDNHFGPAHSSKCAFSVSPVHIEDEPSRGLFVDFEMGKDTFVARASLFNGRFSVVEVYRMELSNSGSGVRFSLLASTKLQYQVLDIKATSCDISEAYITLILTKDGVESTVQLLVLKPAVEMEQNPDEFVLAHNGQLAGIMGVADVSVTCYLDHVVFAFAHSPVLSPAEPKGVPSTIHVWSPKTRSIITSLIVETVNSVSVVAFQSGECLMLLFAQNSHVLGDDPLDMLLYCLSTGRNVWKLNLLQSIHLCDAYGINLYRNSHDEVTVFIAVSPKARLRSSCPVMSLAMKWTGKELITVKNITAANVFDFHYFPSSCCNLLLARHTHIEKSVSVVGSTEALFENVQKLDTISMEGRHFFLISFSSTSQQDLLQEFKCDLQMGTMNSSLHVPKEVMSMPLQLRSDEPLVLPVVAAPVRRELPNLTSIGFPQYPQPPFPAPGVSALIPLPGNNNNTSIPAPMVVHSGSQPIIIRLPPQMIAPKALPVKYFDIPVVTSDQGRPRIVRNDRTYGRVDNMQHGPNMVMPPVLLGQPGRLSLANSGRYISTITHVNPGASVVISHAGQPHGRIALPRLLPVNNTLKIRLSSPSLHPRKPIHYTNMTDDFDNTISIVQRFSPPGLRNMTTDFAAEEISFYRIRNGPAVQRPSPGQVLTIPVQVRMPPERRNNSTILRPPFQPYLHFPTRNPGIPFLRNVSSNNRQVWRRKGSRLKHEFKDFF